MCTVRLNKFSGNSSMIFELRSIFSKCILLSWKLMSANFVIMLSRKFNILKSWRCSTILVGNCEITFLDKSTVTSDFGKIFPTWEIRLALKSSHTNLRSLANVLNDCGLIGGICCCCCCGSGGSGWCIWINEGNDDSADVEKLCFFSSWLNVISEISFSDTCKLLNESAKLPQLPSRCCIKFLKKFSLSIYFYI